MAKIEEYLEQILSARYGKDVRQSIHDSIKEINDVATGAQGSATAMAGTATQKASEAVEASETAIQKAEEALASAEEAKEAAQTASEVTNIHYANEDRAGIVRPKDIYVDQTDGSMAMITHTDSPTLHNSYPGGIKLNELGGVSEQGSTTGAQLSNASNIYPYGSDTTVNIEDNGKTITVSGMASYAKASIAIHTEDISAIQGTTVTLSGNIKSKSVSSAKVDIQLVITNADGTKSYNGVTNGSSKAVAIPEDAQDVVIDLLVNNTNSTLSEKNTVVFENVMLNVGTTALPWESYTGGQASPNPDYPQEIKSVVVSEVKTVGKNLLNITATKKTVNGVTYDFVRDVNDKLLYIEANGTATANCNMGLGSVDYDGTIVLSGCPSGGSSKTYELYASYDNGASYFREYGDSVEITAKGTTKVWIMVRAGVTVSKLRFYPMIRTADIEDGTYEPYQSSSIALSSPITLNGIGDVKDRFVRKDGVWGVEREFCEFTLDGTQKPVRYNAQGSDCFGFTTFDSILMNSASGSAKAIALGERFMLSTSNAVWTGTIDNIFAISSANSAKLRIHCTKFTSIQDAVDFFTNNPTKFIARLATPTFEPLPTADQMALNSLVSYEGVTYLSCDSEIQPTWDLEYGTSKVGALSLENSNLYATNEVLRASADARILDLEQKIDAINAALPFTITINDTAKTINFADRE